MIFIFWGVSSLCPWAISLKRGYIHQLEPLTLLLLPHLPCHPFPHSMLSPDGTWTLGEGTWLCSNQGCCFIALVKGSRTGLGTSVLRLVVAAGRASIAESHEAYMVSSVRWTPPSGVEGRASPRASSRHFSKMRIPPPCPALPCREIYSNLTYAEFMAGVQGPNLRTVVAQAADGAAAARTPEGHWLPPWMYCATPSPC